jgi:hypothetical protein
VSLNIFHIGYNVVHMARDIKLGFAIWVLFGIPLGISPYLIFANMGPMWVTIW